MIYKDPAGNLLETHATVIRNPVATTDADGRRRYSMLEAQAGEPSFHTELDRYMYRHYAAFPVRSGIETSEKGAWVTIDDRPVFIGGPGQGGGSSGGTSRDWPSGSELVDAYCEFPDGEPREHLRERLEDMMERVPSEAFRHLKKIHVPTEQATMDKAYRRAARGARGKTPGGFYDPANGDIYSFDGGHFWHEIGHAVFRNAPRELGVQWRERWEKRGFDKTTWYSKTHFEEGFAETFSAFCRMGGTVSEGYLEVTEGRNLNKAFEHIEKVLDALP